jgi:F0F1-type ATP synthase assembly protein I
MDTDFSRIIRVDQPASVKIRGSFCSDLSEVFRQWTANCREDDHGLMSNGSEQSKLALTLTVVTLFSSNILGGILIGYLLDRWLGSDPWLTITGIVLGLTGAIIGLIRVLNRLNRDN